MENEEKKARSGETGKSGETSWRGEGKDGLCLRLEKVSKSFGGLEAVRSVSLDVAVGERRSIIGPNGAGKTTLFNLIAGALSISSGRVLFLGEDISRLACHRRASKGIARTFQITNLFPNLTVMENMILAVQALQKTKFNFWSHLTSRQNLYQKGMEWLGRMGIENHKDELVKNLSYGIQRQIELLLALTGNPTLLLLDEPTAGLSPSEAMAMVELLRSLPRSITMILIEHDMEVAFQLSNRITVLHFGSVIAEGSVEEIKENDAVQEIYLGKK
jgi:branched-chain amino acid transport system ATP-binding protein